MKAQLKLTANAPRPASDNNVGSGGVGKLSFCQAAHSVATLGTKRIAANSIPTLARLRALQANAKKISKLTDVSSRKSIESANRETDLMEIAT